MRVSITRSEQKGDAQERAARSLVSLGHKRRWPAPRLQVMLPRGTRSEPPIQTGLQSGGLVQAKTLGKSSGQSEAPLTEQLHGLEAKVLGNMKEGVDRRRIGGW